MIFDKVIKQSAGELAFLNARRAVGMQAFDNSAEGRERHLAALSHLLIVPAHQIRYLTAQRLDGLFQPRNLGVRIDGRLGRLGLR